MKDHVWIIVSSLFPDYQMRIYTKEIPEDINTQSHKFGYTPYLIFTWEE